MSAAFVLDCSIAVAWLFNDEATPKTGALLTRLTTETALVPAWRFIRDYECPSNRGAQGPYHFNTV